MFQMPMAFCVAAQHAKLRGRDAAPLGLLHFELGARAEFFERLHQLMPTGAGVDQRAHRHVSADSGERV
jgi:hypothetical protein